MNQGLFGVKDLPGLFNLMQLDCNHMLWPLQVESSQILAGYLPNYAELRPQGACTPSKSRTSPDHLALAEESFEYCPEGVRTTSDML